MDRMIHSNEIPRLLVIAHLAVRTLENWAQFIYRRIEASTCVTRRVMPRDYYMEGRQIGKQNQRGVPRGLYAGMLVG